jgi:hypothetical protein
LYAESEKKGAKANNSDRKPAASPSINPTNPQKKGQLAIKNPTTEEGSFCKIS